MMKVLYYTKFNKRWLYPKPMVTWLATTLWVLKPLSVSYPFIQATRPVTVVWISNLRLYSPSWCQQLLSAAFHIFMFATSDCFLFHAITIKDSQSDLVLVTYDSGSDNKKNIL
jgi:hypothetical protein